MNTDQIWKLRDEIVEARTALLDGADGHYWDNADLSKSAGDYQQQIDIVAHMAEADEASRGDDNLTVTETDADELNFILTIWLPMEGPRTPAQIDADQQDRDYAATVGALI